MSTLERARTAAGGCDWHAAYDAVSAADDEGGLTGGDLELLAEAAFGVAPPSLQAQTPSTAVRRARRSSPRARRS